MTSMGSFIERFFPAKPEKTPTPLISVFLKKYFPGTRVFLWESSCDFFRDVTSPLIWDPLGPHTIPIPLPEESRRGTAHEALPMSLRRGGQNVVVMDFTASNRGSSPGWCTKPRGRMLQNNGSTFFFCWQIKIMVWDNHWTDQTTERWPIAYMWLVSFWVVRLPNLPAISYFHKISEDPCFEWIETSWSSLDIPRWPVSGSDLRQAR